KQQFLKLVTETYIDGTIAQYHVLPNRTREGLYTALSEDGQILERCTYQNGVKHGVCEQLLPFDLIIPNLSTRCSYVNGKKDGLYESWYPDGQKYEKYMYKNGLEDGLYESWHRNGQMSKTIQYNHGAKDGLF